MVLEGVDQLKGDVTHKPRVHPDGKGVIHAAPCHRGAQPELDTDVIRDAHRFLGGGKAEPARRHQYAVGPLHHLGTIAAGGVGGMAEGADVRSLLFQPEVIPKVDINRGWPHLPGVGVDRTVGNQFQQLLIDENHLQTLSVELSDGLLEGHAHGPDTASALFLEQQFHLSGESVLGRMDE